jgi:hypothetical protein
MQTKKHFEATAALIRQIKDKSARVREREWAIDNFVQSNPRFDKKRFRALCDGDATPKVKHDMPPGVTYQYTVRVDTSEWFPDPKLQFEDLWKVTYKGVTYDLSWGSDECRHPNHYPKNHVWAGQVESQTLDMRHVFEQFVGRKPTYNCGTTEVSAPDCRLMDFLCDFLFNVEGCEDIEGTKAYSCDMQFTVDIDKREVFEKDLAKLANILRSIKYEYGKDRPKED